MKKWVLAAAIAALGVSTGATAATMEDRLAAMEARMAQLESRVIDQSREIEAKNARIAQLESAAATAPRPPVARPGSSAST
ncbi:MAG: carbohydrate porin [Rhodocyclaceae bacterium]|nr:carbohydrate porin [Rhodocyclaceae bacterium]